MFVRLPSRQPCANLVTMLSHCVSSSVAASLASGDAFKLASQSARICLADSARMPGSGTQVAWP